MNDQSRIGQPKDKFFGFSVNNHAIVDRHRLILSNSVTTPISESDGRLVSPAYLVIIDMGL